MPKVGAGAEVQYTEGDLLECAGYIFHQAHCNATGVAAGYDADIRRRLDVDPYPHAVRVCHPKMGSVRIDKVYLEGCAPTAVVHMYCQLYRGRASLSSPDTVSCRTRAFDAALHSILGKVFAGTIPETPFFFPHGIGCGLAGGNWAGYERIIANFAAQLPAGYPVTIVRKPAPVRTAPTPSPAASPQTRPAARRYAGKRSPAAR